MKLCIIYNFAAHYRQGIFKLMDDAFDCVWYFGKANQDIKKMDYSIFKGAITELDTKRYGGLTFQQGVLSLLGKYDRFLMLGDSRSVSTWLFLLFSKFFHRKKVYLWSHGFYGKESGAESFIKKVIFKLADGIFLYNNYARELMLKKGFKASKLHVIHNSLNYDEQVSIRNSIVPSNIYREHFKNDNPNLIFIGRLTKVKRLDMLLDAVKLISKQGQAYNIVFVGDGVERQSLEQKTKELGLGNNVWFYGACYDEKTNAKLIYNADLCVAPGNVGLTAMHTMVFGTPVLTHNDFKWQMPEFEAIVPNKTGNFFQRDNVNDLALKIVNWFEVAGKDRDVVRKACFDEIDTSWNPQFQLEVIKNGMHL